MIRYAVLLGVLACGCSNLALDAARPYPCTNDDDCRGGWVCGLEGRCHAAKPGPWVCADGDGGTASCFGWHCGLEGRCYSKAEPVARPCDPPRELDGGRDDCPDDWRCGLERSCHREGELAAWKCTDDSHCEGSWRCGPLAVCIDPANERLVRRSAPVPMFEEVSPTGWRGLPVFFSAAMTGVNLTGWAATLSLDGTEALHFATPAVIGPPWVEKSRATLPPGTTELAELGRSTLVAGAAPTLISWLADGGGITLAIDAGHAALKAVECEPEVPGAFLVGPDGLSFVAADGGVTPVPLPPGDAGDIVDLDTQRGGMSSVQATLLTTVGLYDFPVPLPSTGPIYSRTAASCDFASFGATSLRRVDSQSSILLWNDGGVVAAYAPSTSPPADGGCLHLTSPCPQGSQLVTIARGAYGPTSFRARTTCRSSAGETDYVLSFTTGALIPDPASVSMPPSRAKPTPNGILYADSHGRITLGEAVERRGFHLRAPPAALASIPGRIVGPLGEIGAYVEAKGFGHVTQPDTRLAVINSMRGSPWLGLGTGGNVSDLRPLATGDVAAVSTLARGCCVNHAGSTTTRVDGGAIVLLTGGPNNADQIYTTTFDPNRRADSGTPFPIAQVRGIPFPGLRVTGVASVAPIGDEDFAAYLMSSGGVARLSAASETIMTFTPLPVPLGDWADLSTHAGQTRLAYSDGRVVTIPSRLSLAPRFGPAGTLTSFANYDGWMYAMNATGTLFRLEPNTDGGEEGTWVVTPHPLLFPDAGVDSEAPGARVYEIADGVLLVGRLGSAWRLTHPDGGTP